jgi:transposase-like protein
MPTTRNKRRSPNEVFETRRLKLLTKNTTKKEEAKQAKQAKQEAPKPVKAKRKKKPANKLTPEQLEARRKAKELYKNNPAEYFINRFRKQNEATENRKAVKAATQERQKENPDKFKSILEFNRLYRTEQDCKDEYVNNLSLNEDGMPTCPYCKRATKVYAYRSREIFKCKECDRQYRLSTGTILHKMKIPLDEFFLLLVHEVLIKDGLKVTEGVGLIGRSSKTAFFNLRKIRGTGFRQQRKGTIAGKNPVSIDTTAVFGSNVNRHDYKKLSKQEIYRLSTQVLVTKERFGNAVGVIVAGLTKTIMEDRIKEIVPANATIFTDEHKSFKGISAIEGMNYTHETTNHSAGEHARGNVTTNPVENLNSQIKLTIDAHRNCFSKVGLGFMINMIIFKSNASAQGLTLCEQFMLALKNVIRFNEVQGIAKIIYFRPSVFKKLAIAA